MLADAAISLDYPAILSRVFHTTCAATLLGGLVYLRFVLAPAIGGSDAEAVCFAGRRKAWAGCVGICSGLLLASGSYNFYLTITQYEKLPALYHMAFGVKFLLAFAVFTLMALAAGRTGLAERMRARFTFWLNVSLTCALTIFLLGAVLRQVPKVPKAAPSVPSDSQEAKNVDTIRGFEDSPSPPTTSHHG